MPVLPPASHDYPRVVKEETRSLAVLAVLIALISAMPLGAVVWIAVSGSTDSLSHVFVNVLPKAASFAWPRLAPFIFSKNCMALGFDPGQPPSM